MNPETPPTPREEIEVRLTALLLGELSPDEAAALQAQMAADPELTALHARLRQAIELLREASAIPEHPAAPLPARLSTERRERLLAHFRGTAPAPAPVLVLPRRDWKWLVPLGLAASLIALLGGTVLISGFVQRKASVGLAFSDLNGNVAEWASQPGSIRAWREGAARGGDTAGVKIGKDLSEVRVPSSEAESDFRFAQQRKESNQEARDAGVTKNLPLVPKAARAAPSLPALAVTKSVSGNLIFTSPAARGDASSPTNAPMPVTAAAATPAPSAPFFATINESSATPALAPPSDPAAGGRLADGGRVSGLKSANKTPPSPAPILSTGTLAFNGRAASPAAAAQPAAPPTHWNFESRATPTAPSVDQQRPMLADNLGVLGDKSESRPALEFTTRATDAAPLADSTLDRQVNGGFAGGGAGREKPANVEDLNAVVQNGITEFKGATPLDDGTIAPRVESKPLAWFADAARFGTASPAQPVDQGTALEASKRLKNASTARPEILAGEAIRSMDLKERVVGELKKDFAGADQIDQSRRDNIVPQRSAEILAITPDNLAPGQPQVNKPGASIDEVRLTAAGATRSLETEKLNKAGANPIRDPNEPTDPDKPVSAGQPIELAKLEEPVVKQMLKEQVEEDVLARTQAPPAAIPQPEIATSANAFSTFSLNVSDVAFKLAGASLEKGQMPELATVRSEEFINAFDYRDPEPAPGAPLAFATERARYPFAQNRDLVRFSVKTAAAGRQPGRALNIVLLLDNSGSMERADRVRILHESLRVLATQLQPQDKLSVVTFSRTPRLWADGVAGDKAGVTCARVGEITPQGGTNIGAALDLGYKTALKHYQPGSINRVVLLTDGAANLGDVNPDALKQKVEAHRKQGVALDCFGIGWEGYDDAVLEALSRNGDGRYGFINSPEEAATEFAAQLAGALRVAASDVKVQVEWNPRRVTAYRQIGYAKHQLKKEQFRDNTVDAAEIGAAESGNALYVCEVNPRGEGDLATVRVRFKVPGTSDYKEHEWTVPYTKEAPPLEQASPALRLAGTASAFSEWLVASQYATEVTTDRLLGLLNGVPAIYGADPRPKKLEWMIRTAKSVSGR